MPQSGMIVGNYLSSTVKEENLNKKVISDEASTLFYCTFYSI